MKVSLLIVIISSCAFSVAHAKTRVKRETYYDVYRALDTQNETEAIRLIENGIDANFKDGNGQLALHYAAKYAMDKVAILLIKKGYGSQINRGDKWGDTPIHEAASRGSEKVMEIFIKNGGNMDKPNVYGKTALHWAADKGYESVVRLLLKNGADANAIENNGLKPVQFAKNSDHQSIVEILEEAQKKQKINKYIERVCERYIAEKPTDYIIGGRAALPEEFPWMVALGYISAKTNSIVYRCGGTIISERFILTAAHCTNPEQPPIVVRLGTISLSNHQNARNYYIKNIHQHEMYSVRTKRNDIALIQLSKSIVFDPEIRPACLETDVRDKSPNIGLNVTGWGSTTASSYEMSDKLLTAGLITMPLNQCNSIYVEFNKNANLPAFRDGISESQYCAYHPSFQSDSCRGDSGGPIQVFRDPETAHTVGIVSFGMGCNNSFPAIYTRVAYYTDWIASHVWPDAQ